MIWYFLTKECSGIFLYILWILQKIVIFQIVNHLNTFLYKVFSFLFKQILFLQYEDWSPGFERIDKSSQNKFLISFSIFQATKCNSNTSTSFITANIFLILSSNLYGHKRTILLHIVAQPICTLNHFLVFHLKFGENRVKKFFKGWEGYGEKFITKYAIYFIQLKFYQRKC